LEGWGSTIELRPQFVNRPQNLAIRGGLVNGLFVLFLGVSVDFLEEDLLSAVGVGFMKTGHFAGLGKRGLFWLGGGLWEDVRLFSFAQMGGGCLYSRPIFN
jgi:hypothetical protein